MNVWGNIKKVLVGGSVAGALVFMSSLTITGCLTNSDKKDSVKDTTPVATHTQWAAETTIPAGAQGASLGSALDLDAKVALLSAAANAAQGDIDLVFMFYGGAMHIDNAVSAKAAGIANNINLTNSYDDTKIQNVQFVKVTTKPADQEAGKAAFTSGTKIVSSTIAKGDMFVVYTTGGKYALVTVGDIVGTDNKANANFNVTVSTI